MGLTASQMARMSRLLDEALPLDRAGRLCWIEALAPQDQDLVTALKGALLPEEGGDALATLPKVESDGASASQLKPGDRVGPYRLERPLGSGGMAEVWLAQRADGAFRREVALKLPILSRLRKDLASRFARERDILAGLEHANIARLYDAGVSAEGAPYLTMEYVRGEPLTAWCDRHRLGIRERLKLFLQVLEAVQYAHGHQVIHRDIKPSNILVTDSGQVRLLDFGVAKLLAEEDEHAQLTQIYGRALTPDYASPELVRGEAIDAAADVYSLGVVLYELVSGNRPYRLKAGASVAHLEQAICEARIERPSAQLELDAGAVRATTQDKLARGLREGLDAIVLKALAKAPRDRYGNAAALADDLQRYLAGEPVQARPDRFLLRLSKFALRYLPGPAQNTFTSAPGPAQVHHKSIAVLPFVDISENRDQEYFSDGLTDELIAHLTRFPGLRVTARTSSFYFKGKQATIAEIAKTLAAGHVLEGSVRKSGNELRITARLIDTSDGSHVWSQIYDRSLSDIFRLQDEISGKVVQALKIALYGRITLDGTDKGEPQDKTSGNVEAHNLLLQGNYFFNRITREDTERATVLYQQAIELDPKYALAWARLANTYDGQVRLGWVSTEEGIARARSAVERALQIDQKLAFAHLVLGKLHRDFDWDWAKAKMEFERALDLDPNDAIARVYLSFLMGNLNGRYEEHIGCLRDALLVDPLDTVSMRNLIGALCFAGRLDEAADMSRRLHELNPTGGGEYASLALILLLMGRASDAFSEAQKEPDEGRRLWVLPLIYWSLGRLDDSEAVLTELKNKYAAVAAFDVATIHAYRRDRDAAFEWLDRAYQQRDAGMQLLKVDPLLLNLHGDPRFGVLLVKMRLTS